MSESKLPRHVGIIMDGNGRWAEKRGQKRNFGHSAGMEALTVVAERARERGIEYLTVYALSTENLKNRPQEELDGLFDLLRKYFTNNIEKLKKGGAAVKVIGDISQLPEDIIKKLNRACGESPKSVNFTVIFAINYGSRPEILRAANALRGGGEITEDMFANSLYTAGIPDPDLIIRTGGEKRLSNFLCWQAAYAELYFTDVLFPDFGKEELDKALEEYSGRNRRFGGTAQ